MTTLVKAEEDAAEFFGWACEQGWTDGLPVIPPTAERIRAMMATVDLDPDYVVASLPPRRAAATVEKLAANAVMAGCLPEYFPVVVAAVEASPPELLHGINTTTNSVAPMYIVNGPIRNEIGMNGSYSAMGPGNRANATIGRALSLIMTNIADRRPGEGTKSTFGQPARYTCCIAEWEENSPWEPFHVERGFSAGESTVTFVTITGTINSTDIHGRTGEEVLHTHAGAMVRVGARNFPGEIGLILAPSHAKVTAEQFTRQQARQWLFEEINRIWRKCEGEADSSEAAMLASPDQLYIVVAGGPGGYHSIIAHSYVAQHGMMTVPIRHRK